MAKRKRDAAGPTLADFSVSAPPIHVQVITGTYEKTLHGFIIDIPSSTPHPDAAADKTSLELPAKFTDTFLFTAHTSPLRTLAISPLTSNSTKSTLATASADERVNLYTLSTILPPDSVTGSLKPLSGRNKHLGTLHHHINTPTALVFTPNRSKFISAGADGRIHILRCRDWNLLSTLKAPKPKSKPVNYAKDYGEGEGPRIDALGSEGYGGGAGTINDIALHPSQKIMLSVEARSRTVRLWNLMTGRKAGVLVIERKLVPAKFGIEANRVEWNAAGNQYAVAFDRGIIVFGMDSRPKLTFCTDPLSKIHMMRYATLPRRVFSGKPSDDDVEVIMLSTEDGRILFYSTEQEKGGGANSCKLLGVLGGRSLGMASRIKDFALLSPVKDRFLVVTGCSDGTVRMWDLTGHGTEELQIEELEQDRGRKKAKIDDSKQVGRLVGIYETARRITCLVAMVMHEGEEVEDVEMEEASNDESSSEDSE